MQKVRNFREKIADVFDTKSPFFLSAERSREFAEKIPRGGGGKKGVQFTKTPQMGVFVDFEKNLSNLQKPKSVKFIGTPYGICIVE